MARKAYNLEMAMEKPEEVEELSMVHRKLKKIPEKVFQLKNLKKIDFSNNLLTEIPKELIYLKKLRDLNFHKNNLREYSFTHLTSENFPHLNVIDLGGNKIQHLPKHFFQFKDLTHLNISWNRITVIPSEIVQFKKIISLVANNNLIAKLPEEISKLESLSHLNIGGNRFELLPPTFTNLKSLITLNLIHSPLQNLPKDFAKMNNLICLQLSISKKFSTKDIHEQFGNIKKLWIKGDKELSIPNNVFQVYNLEELSLVGFDGSDIHPSIGKLQKLRKLQITRNRLTHLPDSIGCLNSLEDFTVLSHSLKKLPSSLVHLQKLRRFTFGRKFKKIDSTVNRFLKKIKHETFPIYLKEAAFNFIFSKDNSLDHLSKKELLILTQFPFQNLGKAVENLLYQKHSLDILKNPFDKNTHLAFLGKTNLNFKKIKPHLKNISKKITPQTTHVVLGKLPGEIENLASRDFVFVRESELNLWVQQQENPYLLSSSKEEIENLSRLLLSFQSENIDLALQIMKTGGVPTTLLTDLVIVFKKLPNGKQKRAIRKLLSLHLSEAALRVVSLKTGLLKADDLEKKILELTDETVLDGLKISKYLTLDKK